MDVIISGGLAGMIGYTVCGLTNFIFYSLGILPSTGIHYNAVFFSAPGIPISWFTLLIGIMAGYVTGPFVGVLIAFLLTRTGYDYAWLKGYGLATVLWPVHVAIIPLMDPRLYSTLPPIMVFACFFFEAIFGMVTALVLQYWHKQNKISVMPQGN